MNKFNFNSFDTTKTARCKIAKKLGYNYKYWSILNEDWIVKNVVQQASVLQDLQIRVWPAEIASINTIAELLAAKDTFPLDFWTEVLPIWLDNWVKKSNGPIDKFAFLEIEKQLGTLPAGYELSNYKLPWDLKFPDSEVAWLNKEDQINKTLDKFYKESNIQISEIQKGRISRSIFFDLPKLMSLPEIFNLLHTTEDVVFLTWNNIYKHLEKYTQQLASNNWSFSLSDTIGGQLLSKYSDKNFREQINYTEFYCFINELEQLEVFATTKVLEDFDRIITFITSQLKCRLNRVEYLFFEMDCWIKNLGFDKNELSRWLLVDPIFRQKMAIDESVRATKTKNYIYIYAFPTSNDNTITSGGTIHAEDDVRIIKQIPDQIGPSAINLRVSRLTDEAMGNYIIGLFVALFSKFSGSKTSPVIEPSEKNVKLKYIEPKLFIVGFPKLCLVQPTPIKNEQIPEYEAAGYQVMTFPNEQEAAIAGIKQRNYVCIHQQNKYPGIRENKLPNKNIFSHLPCCYKTKQIDVPGSKYDAYMQGQVENTIVGTGGKNVVIKTSKILGDGSIGLLSSKLENFLRNIMNEPRKVGVQNSQISILIAIMQALNDGAAVKASDISKIEAKIQNAHWPPSSLNYMSGPHYLVLLTQIFNANIWIWSDEDILIAPNAHSLISYEWSNERRNIHLYENFGTELDHSPWPQYEIIFNKQEYTFKDSTSCKNLASKLWIQYFNSEQISPFVEPYNYSNFKGYGILDSNYYIREFKIGTNTIPLKRPLLPHITLNTKKPVLLPSKFKDWLKLDKSNNYENIVNLDQWPNQNISAYWPPTSALKRNNIICPPFNSKITSFYILAPNLLYCTESSANDFDSDNLPKKIYSFINEHQYGVYIDEQFLKDNNQQLSTWLVQKIDGVVRFWRINSPLINGKNI